MRAIRALSQKGNGRGPWPRFALSVQRERLAIAESALAEKAPGLRRKKFAIWPASCGPAPARPFEAEMRPARLFAVSLAAFAAAAPALAAEIDAASRIDGRDGLSRRRARHPRRGDRSARGRKPPGFPRPARRARSRDPARRRRRRRPARARRGRCAQGAGGLGRKPLGRQDESACAPSGRRRR